MRNEWKHQYFITPKEDNAVMLKHLLRLGAKLIDDLCDAHHATLLPDDQRIRDAMAEQGKE